MFLMWVKIGYWMKLFEGPAMFITQIYEVIASIKGFISIYLVVLAAFANLFAIIQLNTFEDLDKAEYNYVSKKFENRFYDSIYQVYLFSVGEFANMDENTGGDNEDLAHVAFILSTMILLILFMNMIIAIMSEKFSEVQGNAELYKF